MATFWAAASLEKKLLIIIEDDKETARAIVA
jgi:hypothetical protein